MLWSETLARDLRRDATHEAAIPRGDWDLHADDGYEIPTFDVAVAAGLKTVKLLDRSKNGGGQWPGGYLNVSSVQVADGWKPAAGNDGSMEVIDSRTGRWTHLWAFGVWLSESKLFGVIPWRSGPAPSGCRWVAAAVEVRVPIRSGGKVVDSLTPVDYRTWNGNGWKVMGAGLGPAARGATAAELAYAVAQDGILPRIIPAYVPNTGGAVCPAATCENPNPQAGDIPGGLR
jgi:hypothetical protein